MKKPTTAPGSAPAAIPSEEAKTPRASSIPKASDAARYVPGGGAVKIFSQKMDLSNVKSKVPSADVTGVAAPAPSKVKIVSQKIDLSGVKAKVPGADVSAAASAEKPKQRLSSVMPDKH